MSDPNEDEALVPSDHLGVAESVRYIAETSDRWFLEALRSVRSSADWTQSRAGELGKRLKLDEVRARIAERVKGSRPDRLRKALYAEASKVELDATEEELEAFIEQMVTLMELIFSGTVKARDIVIIPENVPEDDAP